MNSQILQIEENFKLKKSLEYLVDGIIEIPRNANTPLALNLKTLAVIADASYIKHILYVLLNKWKKELPFIGEFGTELDWEHYRRSLCAARGELNWIQTDFSEFFIQAELPAGVNKWRHWEDDENYRLVKSQNEGDRHSCNSDDLWVESNDYGRYLDPTLRSNSWFFCSESIKQMASEIKRNTYELSDYSLNSMKRGLRAFSHEHSNYLFVRTLIEKVDDIIDLIEELEIYKNFPSKIYEDSYQYDKIMAKFFNRLYPGPIWEDDRVSMAKKWIDEYKEWKNSYQRDMKIDFLIARQERDFLKLLDSGFLNPFMDDYKINKDDVALVRKLFDSFFFEEKGAEKHKMVKSSVVGRYIYNNQFKGIEWRTRIVAFLCYLYIEDKLDCHIRYIDRYYNNESFRLEKWKIAVKSSILKLLDLKCDDRYIFREPKHWICIYRVLVDKDIFGIKDSKYKSFENLINDLSPEGFRVPFDYNTLKNITKSVYHKHLNEWDNSDSIYGECESSMLCIAKEFQRILDGYIYSYQLK